MMSSLLIPMIVLVILLTTTTSHAFMNSYRYNNLNHYRHLNAIESDNNDGNQDTDTSTSQLGKQICTYKTITIEPSGMNEGESPRQAVSVEDLTPQLQSFISDSNIKNGVLHVISRHTTTAITINEKESRLEQDIANFFLTICPPDERSSSNKKVNGVRYLHNDIDKRPDGEEEAQRCRDNGWDVDNEEELEKWRNQEPINAHSHLISIMLGSSECIPIVDGQMVIGQESPCLYCFIF